MNCNDAKMDNNEKIESKQKGISYSYLFTIALLFSFIFVFNSSCDNDKSTSGEPTATFERVYYSMNPIYVPTTIPSPPFSDFQVIETNYPGSAYNISSYRVQCPNQTACDQLNLKLLLNTFNPSFIDPREKNTILCEAKIYVYDHITYQGQSYTTDFELNKNYCTDYTSFAMHHPPFELTGILKDTTSVSIQFCFLGARAEVNGGLKDIFYTTNRDFQLNAQATWPETIPPSNGYISCPVIVPTNTFTFTKTPGPTSTYTPIPIVTKISISIVDGINVLYPNPSLTPNSYAYMKVKVVENGQNVPVVGKDVTLSLIVPNATPGITPAYILDSSLNRNEVVRTDNNGEAEFFVHCTLGENSEIIVNASCGTKTSMLNETPKIYSYDSYNFGNFVDDSYFWFTRDHPAPSASVINNWFSSKGSPAYNLLYPDSNNIYIAETGGIIATKTIAEWILFACQISAQSGAGDPDVLIDPRLVISLFQKESTGVYGETKNGTIINNLTPAQYISFLDGNISFGAPAFGVFGVVAYGANDFLGELRHCIEYLQKFYVTNQYPALLYYDPLRNYGSNSDFSDFAYMFPNETTSYVNYVKFYDPPVNLPTVINSHIILLNVAAFALFKYNPEINANWGTIGTVYTDNGGNRSLHSIFNVQNFKNLYPNP